MSRRISDEEVEAAILASQHRRAAARRADPRWQMIDPGDGLPGLIWRQVVVRKPEEESHDEG